MVVGVIGALKITFLGQEFFCPLSGLLQCDFQIWSSSLLCLEVLGSPPDSSSYLDYHPGLKRQILNIFNTFQLTLK